MLAATAVAVFLFVPPIDRKGIAADLVGAAPWGANWRFAAESTQYMADTAKSLGAALLVAERGGTVLRRLAPLLLLLAGRSGMAKRVWSVFFRRTALALGLVIVASLVLSWQLSGSGSPFAYFGLHTRAWELGIGAASPWADPSCGCSPSGRLGRWLAVSSRSSPRRCLMDEATPFPGTAALVPVLGTAMLVAAGARLPDEGISRALSNPVARYIGRVSYAWYLWHWPVLVIANSRFGRPPLASPRTEAAAGHAGWPVVLAAVALSFALAVASHYLVEQPMRQASSSKASRRRSLQFGVPSSQPRSSARAALSGRGRGAGCRRQARQDTPQILEKCNNNPQTVSVRARRGVPPGPAKGKRTIALIGDSHSQHWQPAMQRLAEERGWTVYIFMKNSCTVSDVPIYLKQNNAEYTGCAEWRQAMVKRVSDRGPRCGGHRPVDGLPQPRPGTRTAAARPRRRWASCGARARRGRSHSSRRRRRGSWSSVTCRGPRSTSRSVCHATRTTRASAASPGPATPTSTSPREGGEGSGAPGRAVRRPDRRLCPGARLPGRRGRHRHVPRQPPPDDEPSESLAEPLGDAVEAAIG